MSFYPPAPFRHDELPDAIAADLEAAIEARDYAAGADLIEDYLYETDERAPDVLGALAYCVFIDGLEIMVDEVLERGERALALLEEARDAGLPPTTTAPFEALITDVVQDARERVAATKALGARDDLTIDEAKDLAYHLAETGEDYVRAARLFRRVYDADPDRNHYYYARSGTELARGDAWGEAMPILREIIDGDIPTIHTAYQHFVFTAFNQLLRHAMERDDVEGFLERWEEALEVTAKVDTHGWSYPFARPAQDRCLRFAVKRDLPDVARHLIEIFDAERQSRDMTDEVRELLEEARARYV